MNASRELFPRSESLYRVQLATDAAVRVMGDSVLSILSVQGVTEAPGGPHSSCPATATGTDARPRGANTEAVTDGGTLIPMPGSAGSVQRDEKKFVTSKPGVHSRAKPNMLHCARRYGYDRSEDIYEFAKLLLRPVTDRYCRAVHRMRSGSGRPRRL